jgi:hypothetical protein
MPELERRLISLYWNQCAVVRIKGENSSIIRRLRQGCVLSYLLFNLYSKYMIMGTVESMPGITIDGQSVDNLRCADDAVLMRRRSYRLSWISHKKFVSNIRWVFMVKKTKVLVISEKGEEIWKIVMNGTTLEQVSKYKYVGICITLSVAYLRFRILFTLVLLVRNYLFSYNRWPAMISSCVSGNLLYHVVIKLNFGCAQMANKLMMMMVGSVIIDEGQCGEEVKTRIAMEFRHATSSL